jgi:hypothetical protein
VQDRVRGSPTRGAMTEMIELDADEIVADEEF